MNNIIGNKYGRLIVLFLYGRNKAGYILWTCLCDCGKIKNIKGSALKNRETKSCGCYQKERAAECFTKHGLSTTKLYDLWTGMMQRCYNKKSQAYKHYGARGIKVSKPWHSFETWYEEFGKHKTNGMTMDRIDNNGSYSIENCRWTDRKTQGGNTRRNILLTNNGETKCLSYWSRNYNINTSTARNRYVKGMSFKEIFKTTTKHNALSNER